MRKTQISALAALMMGAGTMASAAADFAESDRCRGYSDDPEAKTITFIFDNTLWKAGNLSKVEVRGSFNGWTSKPEYAMEQNPATGLWTVTVPYSSVRVPGNSGQPEFKFVTNGSAWQSGSGRSFMPEGYVFMNGDNNNIVVFESDDFEHIKENSALANIIRKVSDFDLTTREGKEEISNFRAVPGTSRLFRSYHPYKWTKTSNATEPLRIQYLSELAETEGIRSDICLSENEENNLLTFTLGGERYTEIIPDWYRDIISRDGVLYVGTANGHVPTYNEVYYSPDGERFGQWVSEIVDFIISDDTEAPYLIHCRIGTDRTGMFSGTLAALCGASWSEIEADYEMSTRMGIQEYRGGGLARYGFEQMLGVGDIREVEDLAGAVADNLIARGVVTDDRLHALRVKLGARNLETGVESVIAGAEPVATEYHTMTGIRVDGHPVQPGVYIRSEIMPDGSRRSSVHAVR